MNRRLIGNITKVLAGLALVGGIYWIVRCECVNLKTITPAAIRDYIQGFGNLAALVYILAYTLNTISLVPPIAILSLTSGLAFGKIWGTVYLMTGAMLGTSATFIISRFFGRGLAEKLLKGKFQRLDDLLERRAFITVLFFRLVPLVPYEVLNYACGLTRMKFRDYFLATFLGLIPGVVISAIFGGALGEIRGLKDMLSFRFALPLGLLILIIMIPLAYQVISKRRK